MVASNTGFHDRFVRTEDLHRMFPGRLSFHQFTRSDAETMVKLGVIPEDASTELLNGLIVHTDRSSRQQDPHMIGQDHRITVERLSALRGQIDSSIRHVESQQPLVCSETHVPQPDFMVLRGTLSEYSDLPTAADAFCFVEVADSSYERDSTTKLAGYAAAGIAQYVIINLRNRTAEVYVNPNRESRTYDSPTIVSQDETLSLRIGPSDEFVIGMKQLLP